MMLFMLAALASDRAFASNIAAGSFAWGENIGWINFSPSQGPGVTVTDSAITGYAWGENIGWINFSPTDGGVINNSEGNLSGYAWGENVGWINFAPTGAGVKIDPATGVFSGYAWGENIGWVNFAPDGVPIKTSWTPQPDTTPDSFTFAPQSGVALNTAVTSNPITITGINMPAPISISVCVSVLCEYSVNGGAFTTSAGTLTNSDAVTTVTVRQTSSSSFSTTTTATLSIGGVNGTFSVMTLAADTTPDPFTFTAQTDVALNTVVTSNTVTITGINTTASISITGGEYSINGASFTSISGTVNNGDYITVRLTSSDNYFATTSTTLTIGSVSGTFSITTVTGNIDPNNDGSRYAYGENVGWINFAPTRGPGVVVSNTGLTGYAWGENIGWINLSPTGGGVINDGAGNLSGYAWGENIGWINFNGVKINPSTGEFSGYAWGENIGWINFAPNGKPINTSWRAGAEVLSVSKTAITSFSRTYTWNITKNVDKTLVEQIGGSATFNYTVKANQTGFTDSNWQVTGTITVSNPLAFPVTGVNVTDSINDPNATCTVTNGTNLTVPANGSVNLSYTCTYSAAPSLISETNTATATTGSGSAQGTDSFTFGTPTTVNKTITVTDTFNGTTITLGTLTATDSTPYASATYTYSHTVNVPTSNCINYTNTATIVETGRTASKTIEVCNAAKTAAVDSGFWQNKNGQTNITNGASTSGVCNSGTWLRQYAPFQDLQATATCSQVTSYVANIMKAAKASGPSMNPMLKAKMLAAALDVYFSDPALGGDKMNAPAPIGGIKLDLTMICKMIDNTNGTATCSGTFENVSSAFGGATSLTVSQMVSYAASQANVGGSMWYGNVKATQGLAKDAFAAINNQVAFSP
jgi:hypothetical protein